MKQVNISKKLNFNKGSIEIRYSGELTNSSIDLNKIETLLEDFLNNHYNNDMAENVTIVRTILKDLEEKILAIFYHDEKSSEIVEYSNSNLFLYEKSKKVKDKEHIYEFKYRPSYGIKLDYNKTDITDYSSIELISKEFTEIIEQIYCLKNAKAIVLDKDDKALIEIYRLFYNENPDFTSKHINIKIQTMMCILAKFGITLEEDYGFSLYGQPKMPISLTLKQKVDKLYPLGEVTNVPSDINLTVYSKEIITIVSECIKEAIVNEEEQIESLIGISNIIHAGKYNLSSDSEIEELSQINKRSTDKIESEIKLVKRIENTINKKFK